ncbi:MAG: single-stranded DNA-binding protein [Corynebacterium sp.]|nr:single-stranded DNA-binding protein [Corynebacterium sp.]
MSLFTMVGRVGSDLSFKRVGDDNKAVVNFRLCATRRGFDLEANSWVDRDHIWVTAEAWGQMAEHIYASIDRGMSVIATGTIRTEEYRDDAGTSRTSVRFRIANLAPDTKYYTVKAYSPEREHGGQTPEGYVEYQPRTKSREEVKVVAAVPPKGVA